MRVLEDRTTPTPSSIPKYRLLFCPLDHPFMTSNLTRGVSVLSSCTCVQYIVCTEDLYFLLRFGYKTYLSDLAVHVRHLCCYYLALLTEQ